MYEGVDTIILNNELAYQDLLPVAFKPLARPMDLAAVAALTERNVRMLQVCAVLEEQGGTKSYWAMAHPDAEPDFHAPACFAAELAAPAMP